MEDVNRTASVLSSTYRHAGSGSRTNLRRDVYVGCTQLTAHPSASPPVPLGNTTRRRQNRERILLVFQAWVLPWGVGGETVEGEQSTRCACACSGRLPPAAQWALRRAGRPDSWLGARARACRRACPARGRAGRGARAEVSHPITPGARVGGHARRSAPLTRAASASRPQAHPIRGWPPRSLRPLPRPRLPAGTDRGWFELVRLHDDVLSV